MTEPNGSQRAARDGVPIPFEELSEEALRTVVAEFVTRDGTELTDEAKKADTGAKKSSDSGGSATKKSDSSGD